MADDTESAQSQALAGIQAAFAEIERFTHPGVGRLRFGGLGNGKVQPVQLPIPADDVMTRVAIGFPAQADAFRACLAAVAAFNAAVDALPADVRALAEGCALWHPQMPAPDWGQGYAAAGAALLDAAEPVRAILG